MNKHLIVALLTLLVGTAAMAQVPGTICVYWDAEGTIQDASEVEVGNAPLPFYEGYVIIFVEEVVSGAAYAMDVVGNDAIVVNQSFPPGLQIGDALTGGVEIGLTDPMYGFLGTPVVISEITVANVVYPNPAHVEIVVRAPDGMTNPIYANGAAELAPLETCQAAVANEDLTFSNVKSLFR